MRRARAPALVLALAFALSALAGCLGPDGPAPGDGGTPADGGGDGSNGGDGADGDDGTGDGGAGTPPGSGDAPFTFNASRAWDLAHEQVHYADGSVRYRVPGTPTNTEAAHLIAGHLEEAGFTASWHHFNATYGCEETPMHNVVGTLPGAHADTADERVFYVGAHYDTRPIAEKDPDAQRQDEPIHGANDGASGVGVLLELARVIGERAAEAPLDATLVFVFFDGEDGGGYKGNDCTDWILGSEAFVADLTEEDVSRADGMILVDLVGDPRAVFPREGYSAAEPHVELGDAVWGVAHGLGFRERFSNATSWQITDDHRPFQEAGITAIDVIDLRADGGVFPGTHHTHADTMENVSPEPLGHVGATLEVYLLGRYG